MTKPAATRFIVVERDMPHPPDKIWRALAQGPLIEEWLMKNDFEPVAGHRFNFRATPMPYWNGVTDCEVRTESHYEIKSDWLLDYHRTPRVRILSGGVAELAHLPDNVDGIVRVLGYPLSFMTILGFWKVPGAIALLAPHFPRLKEWAYAGVFFNVTGAAASHAAVGDYGIYAFHILVNLFLAVLVVASWALRPSSRTLGVLFPAKTACPN